MPPKKKAKTQQPRSRAGSSNPPRSTPSRTRSATPSTTKTNPRSRTKVKAEPVEDDDLLVDPKQGLEVEDLKAWDADDQVKQECWVEIPAWPYPGCEEDQLMFLRPKDAAAWKAKLKGKGKVKERVLYMDDEAEDTNPFFYSEGDLNDDEDGYVVAIRPKSTKRNSQSRSASLKPSSQKGNKQQRRAEAEATASVAQEGAGQAAMEDANAPAANTSQPSNGRLQDMFLSSEQTASAPRNNAQPVANNDSTPLFFEDQADDEERLRSETPAASRASQSHRARIKTSPSYGDRIARPSTSTQAQIDRSRSPTPKPSKPASSQRKDDSALERKKSKKQSDDVKNLRSELNEDAFARSTGARHKEEYRNKLAAFSQARKKARLERGEDVDSSASDDEGDARGKGKGKTNGVRAVSVSSDSSSSSDDSDDSDDDFSSSDSSSDSRDFIVGDDEVEYDEGFQPETSSPRPHPATNAPSSPSRRNRKRYERDSDGRIRLISISESRSSSSGSVLAAHGLSGVGGRKGLDELCLDWLEWAVARVLLTWSAISLSDRERLERGRAALKSRMRSTEERVFSVVMRRQFKWYLTEYPKMTVEALFSDELDRFGSLAKQGCGVCHRRSQRPQYTVTFGGERYNQTTLAPLPKRKDKKKARSDSSSDSSNSNSDSDSDSDAASGRSSDTETWREEGTDERGRANFTFFAGNHCAQRAAVMHKLHHWEWTTMQSVAKHESIRFVRRLLWRGDRAGRGRDGKMGAGAWEVAFCVGEMISPSGRCKWKSKGKDGEREAEGGGGWRKKSSASELESLRRRLKALVEAAIDVNRAR